MAFSFPSSPNPGDKYPVPSVPGIPTYTWDGEKWTTVASPGLHVAKTGDTMSGPLTIDANLSAYDTVFDTVLIGVPPSTDAHATRKDYVDGAVAGKVNRIGDVMSGNLQITNVNASININKTASGQSAFLIGSKGGLARWRVSLGGGDGETGANAGSNFYIESMADNGAAIGTVMSINRANSSAYFSGSVTSGSNVSGAGLVSSGNASVAGTLTAAVLSATGNASVAGTLFSANVSATGSITAAAGVGGSTFYAAAATGFITQGFADYGTVVVSYICQGNPDWSDVQFQGIHARGVWAGARIAINGNGSIWDFRNDGIAYAGSGGSWGGTCDARIKDVKGDYTSGLAEILRINPVRFTYKGNNTDASPDQPLTLQKDFTPSPKLRDVGRAPYKTSQFYDYAKEEKEFVGLIAQDVETVLPETVTLSSGYIDGEVVNDLRLFNMTNLTYALVNAVKELKTQNDELHTRIAVLENA